jgi:hypothetical protein
MRYPILATMLVGSLFAGPVSAEETTPRDDTCYRNVLELGPKDFEVCYDGETTRVYIGRLLFRSTKQKLISVEYLEDVLVLGFDFDGDKGADMHDVIRYPPEGFLVTSTEEWL